MDNVWYCKMGHDLEKSIINHFTSSGQWGNVIWHEAEFMNLRYNCFETKKLYDEHTYVDIPEELYNYVYDYLYIFIDMYHRISPWTMFIYDQKNIHDYLNLFNRSINFIYWLLKKEEIDLVVFPRAPHLGGDFLLYLLAEKMEIKTLIMEQWLFPNRFFHYFSVWDFGTFDTSKKLTEAKPVEIEKRFEKELWYMDELYQKKEKKNVRKFLSEKFRPEYRLLVESFQHEGWKQSLYRYSLRKKYKRNLAEAEENISLDESYVYFPLHLQPEQTTSIFGGEYADQLLALERLAVKLPDDWYIYVKENPKQNFYMRGEYFFERLKSIPKVKFIPGNSNTYQLIAKSKFVATITGTAGWEAISGGKNALVFGWGTWYKKLPGVFQYHEDLDIDDILNYDIDHQELEEKVSELKTKMGTGIIYPMYKKAYPDYDKETNKKNIINSLEKILYES